MFGQLKVIHPQAGRSLAFRTGERIRVGRLERGNELAVADPFLAPTHLLLECGPNECTLRDVSAGVRKHARCENECFTQQMRNSPCPVGLCRANDMSGETGVHVNRKKVSETVLADGDAFVAGTSCFVVQLGSSPFAPPAPLAEEPPLLSAAGQKAVLDHFAKQDFTSFALVDAAREPAVLETLRVQGEIYYSLYDGPEGDKLEEVAPYLVELPAGSPLLERLVTRHWGKSWFCLLSATADFKILRRHFRRFLMVESPEGKQMYFRFYDPRVLRAFLPTCTPAECSDFFGPVASFVVESDAKSGVVVFARDREGRLRRDAIRFE